MVKTNATNGRAEEPAVFHRFADRPRLHEGQLLAETVAVVEMNDGTIKEVPPTDVRFTDRYA